MDAPKHDTASIISVDDASLSSAYQLSNHRDPYFLDLLNRHSVLVASCTPLCIEGPVKASSVCFIAHPIRFLFSRKPVNGVFLQYLEIHSSSYFFVV